MLLASRNRNGILGKKNPKRKGGLRQWLSVAAGRTTWQALKNFIIKGCIRMTKPDPTDQQFDHDTSRCVCMSSIYECLILPGVLWVSSICILLCLLFLKTLDSFIFNYFFLLLSLFLFTGKYIAVGFFLKNNIYFVSCLRNNFLPFFL